MQKDHKYFKYRHLILVCISNVINNKIFKPQAFNKYL